MRMTVQTSLLNVSNENPFPFEYYGVYGYQVLAQKFHSKPGFIVALVYDLQSFNVFAIRIKTKRNKLLPSPFVVQKKEGKIVFVVCGDNQKNERPTYLI